SSVSPSIVTVNPAGLLFHRSDAAAVRAQPFSRGIHAHGFRPAANIGVDGHFHRVGLGADKRYLTFAARRRVRAGNRELHRIAAALLLGRLAVALLRRHLVTLDHFL